MQKLTVQLLKAEAKAFADTESGHKEKSLYGVTDGKAVGTYLEHKFQESLQKKYEYTRGSSAKGIDFPKLDIDIKVTSIRQPQSSCPFKSARQKIYGLGYSLLVFAYDKKDERKSRTATLDIKHVIFIESSQTGDFQTTTGIIKILDNDGNADDLVAFMTERFLPVDEIQASELAKEILKKRPQVGYLTISNALQWRLQYARVIAQAGKVSGVQRIA
ncbi:MAG: restriction endonuclease [Nitrospirae bacterium GWC2_42_7]|nr:MAG: restriction endonuclease [Nitrospirae bacterium GWC2_42_7]